MSKYFNSKTNDKDYLLLDFADQLSYNSINQHRNDGHSNEDGDDCSFKKSGEGGVPITHRRHSKKLTAKEKEHMKHMESLDFSDIDNILLRKYVATSKKRNKILKTFGKWAICTLIGIFCGLAVYCLKESVDKLQDLKFTAVNKYMKYTAIPFFIYLAFNLLYASISCLVVILFGPLTSSSGLPEVKGYLNGIRIQKAFNLKTVVGKIISLIFSFSSSLVIGPEGPMFHIGGGIGSSASQFKSKTLGIHMKQFWSYQNDKDKRDFISCGAAAGVGAAFGAPIGGVLFALEEGSSFWSRQLTWRTFFSCLVATMVANFFLQGFGVSVHDYGVLTFGVSKTYLYSYWELIPFMVMGIIGGLLGALFVHLNVRINYLRKKYLSTRHKAFRLVEVALVVLITSAVCYFPALAVSCRPIAGIIDTSVDVCDITQALDTVQLFCPDSYFNPLASITFTSSESALKLLYSRDMGVFTAPILLTVSVIFFFLCVITSGLYVASGIFIPMMLIGAAWGRLVGLLVGSFLKVDPSIYALVGSAAMMGGSLRMTISLVVIIVELTEGTQYLLPIIIVVMMSKWTGDIFNESIYEHLLELKHIPYLPSQPSKQMSRLAVADAMATNIVSLPEIVSVRTVIETLTNTTHNGFPVVLVPSLHHSDHTQNDLSKFKSSDDNNNNVLNNLVGKDDYDGFGDRYVVEKKRSTSIVSATSTTEADLFQKVTNNGKTLCGLILRPQLLILLKRRIFVDSSAQPLSINYNSYEGAENLPIDHQTFATELASPIPTIDDITKAMIPMDMDRYIDLRPYMNHAICSIKNYSSLSECYRLFRLAGLRHMVVVNVFNQIVGMITRKDLL